MRYFPAFIDLKGRRSLIIGGGAHALAKLRLLTKTAVEITLIAPAIESEISKELEELKAEGRITHFKRSFKAEDLEGVDLVYATSGDDAADEAISKAAQEHGIAVNVVDRPTLSTFITPSIVDRSPLVVAISSAGTAPILARDLRAKIEAMLPARLGNLAIFAEKFRGAVKAVIENGRERRRFWERFFASPLSGRVLNGEEAGNQEEMLALVNRHKATTGGSVAIVGAGPGDPDLLTFKALRYLQQADLVVYDRLVGPEIIEYARRDAERLYAGKAKGAHVLPQDEINHRMLQAALAGKRVVRLKGGDPFIFGRGGEECDFLHAHGVPVEVVPGITAATACAASAGVPLTQRGKAQAVTFVTGHGTQGEPELDWASLVKLGQTICIYMGLSSLPSLARNLMDAGLSGAIPAALIDKGTRDDQKVLRGRLDALENLADENGLEGPTMILIGEVAREAASNDIAELTEFLPAQRDTGARDRGVLEVA